MNIRSNHHPRLAIEGQYMIIVVPMYIVPMRNDPSMSRSAKTCGSWNPHARLLVLCSHSFLIAKLLVEVCYPMDASPLIVNEIPYQIDTISYQHISQQLCARKYRV